MGDPVTAMVAVGMTASVGGSYMAYKGAKKAGKAEQQAQEFNAKVAERNAKVARLSKEQLRKQTEIDILDFKKDFENFQKVSAQMYRVNGFVAETGTPLQVMLDNAYEAEKEVAMIRHNSQIEQSRLEEQAIQGGMQADMNRAYGRSARDAGRYQAYGSLLSGVSNLGTQVGQAKIAGII